MELTGVPEEEGESQDCPEKGAGESGKAEKAWDCPEKGAGESREATGRRKTLQILHGAQVFLHLPEVRYRIAPVRTPFGREIYQERLQRHHNELRWLYMELYDNSSMFAELTGEMEKFYRERNRELLALDRERETRGFL